MTNSKTSAPKTYVAFCKAMGIPLTPAQAAIASVAFDGAPIAETSEYRDLFDFDGQTPASARRVVGLVCGRASGKTSALCAGFVLWRAVTADLSALAPGELAFGVIVAPTLDLARQALRFVIGVLDGSPLVETQDADSITIRRPDGKRVRIEVNAASRAGSTVRGKSIVAAALDEACFMRDPASGVVNDRDIFEAIMPRLMTGGAVVVASTPWLKSGLLYELWEKNFGMPTGALVIHAPTERMRTDDPDLLDRIRAERERNPINARREYDCEWLAAGAGILFNAEMLAAASVADVYAPTPEDSIYMGGDLGLVNDPSAFVAVRRREDGTLDVVDVLEFYPSKGQPIDFATMMVPVSAFVRRNGGGAIRVDGHGYEFARQAIAGGGYQVQLDKVKDDAATRMSRYAAVLNAFREGTVKIPSRFGALCDQLSALTATPKEGGGYKFSAPRVNGHHCDAAMAFILAVEAALQESDGWGALLRQPGGLDAALDVAIGFGGEIEGGNVFSRMVRSKAAAEIQAARLRRMSRSPEHARAKAAEAERLAAEESAELERQLEAERVARKFRWHLGLPDPDDDDKGDGGSPAPAPPPA